MALGAHALAANDIWAVGYDNQSYHYDGTSWSMMKTNEPGTYLTGVFATSHSNVYAVGLYGTIVRNDGTWKELSSGPLDTIKGMWGVSDHDVWIFAADQVIRHFDGSRLSGMGMLAALPTAATGTSNTDIWVGHDNGSVTRFDGTKWTQEATADTAQIAGIYIAAADRVVLVGGHTIQFWDGTRFSVRVTSTLPVTSVWGSGANDLWVGEGGTGCSVQHFDGTSWSRRALGGSCSVLAISGTSSSDIYFAGAGPNTPLHWDGSKFDKITLPPNIGDFDNVFATPTRVFFNDAASSIFIGHGTAWTNPGYIDLAYPVITGWSADKVWIGGIYGMVASYKP